MDTAKEDFLEMAKLLEQDHGYDFTDIVERLK